MTPPVLGIDLGTTNCVVALAADGRIQLLVDDQEQVLFPSVLTLGDGGRLWTGREAVALGAALPGRTAFAVKRLMGRRFSDDVVQRAGRIYPYTILENPADGGVLLQLGERRFTPEEVSGALLTDLCELAARRFGERPREAVITVPAYFHHAQREATQRAATAAGLSALRLLNEPTAAALALPRRSEAERVVAVYDFGGGTFDISIIRMHAQVYEVLATDGDTFLGGDDIDALVCDELSAAFQRSAGVKIRNFPLSWYRLRDAAEKAKKELSHTPHCAVYLPRLVGEDSLMTELTSARLDDLARPLLARSIAICQDTVKAAGLKREELDDVVLVGGQTRMPLLRRMVEEFFGRPAAAGVNPDTAVAEGAAREAAMLRQGGGALLLDVTPITLGINIVGNRMYPLIPHNTKVPVRREHVFTTHRDSQARARMVILQGDNPVASENTRLGEITLDDLQTLERFQARIAVAFEIDADGILHVLAIDRDTGREEKLVIRDSLSPESGPPAGALEEGDSLSPAEPAARPTFAGPFRATELLDVLSFLHANRKTGRVALDGPAGEGSTWLTEGEITHARCGAERGEPALVRLLAMGEGRYAFHESELLSDPREVERSFEDIARLPLRR